MRKAAGFEKLKVSNEGNSFAVFCFAWSGFSAKCRF